MSSGGQFSMSLDTGMDPAAHAFYATLKRQSLFTIYHRLHSAKRPETRQRRMAEMLAKLGRGDSP